MDQIKVIADYFEKKSALIDAYPGFIEGGIAPSLHAIETLPHTGFANTDSEFEFRRLQNEMIEKKEEEKRKKHKHHKHRHHKHRKHRK